MSGLDLVRKMRTRYANVKIIVVTGLKETGLAEKARLAGADSFFFKPLSINHFIVTAFSYLDLKPRSLQPFNPSQRRKRSSENLQPLRHL